ncbi:kelch-like protein 12 [Rhagoletis pomonella]|uniref:kelch-like protein 12 n=1 Tax=Rhagoletis pomonella TaxID=28610 RepID=UPI0017811FA5|nr:kelch-like protein 12 [Rhagoletis pomonella]
MAEALPNRRFIRKDKVFIEKAWDKFFEFFDDENHTDVTFLWRNSQQRITAHRLILAASSAYFNELFQTPRGIVPAIYIENVAPQPFELLIAYCYSGKLYPTKHNVCELLNAATTLKLCGAAAICTTYLKGSTEKPQTSVTPMNPSTSGSMNPNPGAPVITTSQAPSSVPLRNFRPDQIGSRTNSGARVNQTKTVKNKNLTLAPSARRATERSIQKKESILAIRKCDWQKDNESCIYRCDESAKQWIQYDVLLFPRIYSGLAYSNRKLISVGGLLDDQPTSSVYSYNLATQTWMELPAMVTSRGSVCVATVNGNIYAIGGYDGSNRVLGTMEKLNLTNGKKWTLLRKMSMPRRNATALAIGELIYIIGGFDKDWQQLRSVECYNIRTTTWTKCADMHTARHDCGASVLNGIIYVIGSGNLPPFRHDVECYNPHTDTWTKVSSLITARHGINGVTFNGQLLAVGGFLPNNYKGLVEMYNPTQNIWAKTMPLPTAGIYKCFVLPTEELVNMEPARRASLALSRT